MKKCFLLQLCVAWAVCGVLQPKVLSATHYYNCTIHMSSTNYEDSKNITMMFAIVQSRAVTCTYEVCFYGWVTNYTSQGKETVQGFPDGIMDYPPTFFFQGNTENDFLIVRSSNVSRIIGLGIDMFSREINPAAHREAEYRFKPNPANPDIMEGERKNNVEMQGIKTSQDAKQKRRIVFNNKTKLCESKNDKVRAALKEQHLKNQNNQSLGFNKQCSIVVQSMSSFPTNLTVLMKVYVIVEDLKANHSKTSYYNKWRIQHQHQSNAKREVTTKPQVIQTNPFSTQVNGRHLQEYERHSQNQVFSKRFLQATNDTQSQQQDEQTDLSQKNENVRLVFNYSKPLYKKEILGKSTFLTGKGQAWVDSQYFTLRLIFTLDYCLFGGNSSLKLFDSTFMPGARVELFRRFGGTWGMQFRFPLISPLAGVYITLGLYATFFIDVSFHLGGSMTRDVVAFNGGIAASTGFILEVTAALQVLFVEVGVFVEGTLVNLTLGVDLQTNIFHTDNRLQFIVTVSLELRIFAFSWGFFWRFWFFKWSDRMILVNWPINNGIGWKWILFQKAWQGSLHKEVFQSFGDKIVSLFKGKNKTPKKDNPNNSSDKMAIVSNNDTEPISYTAAVEETPSYNPADDLSLDYY